MPWLLIIGYSLKVLVFFVYFGFVLTLAWTRGALFSFGVAIVGNDGLRGP